MTNTSSDLSSLYSYTSSLSSGEDNSSSDTFNLDLKGCVINNYNVITMLGKGSYSRVWLAYCIADEKYYALKVQNPEDYEEGKEEIQILQKIPENERYINRLKEFFIETRKIDNKVHKFICSVFELCCGNLDGLARKGKYKNGYPMNILKKMFKQILLGMHTVHYKLNGFHGDIKPDNILLWGINNRDLKYISLYEKTKFNELYNHTKKEYCGQKNIKKLDSKIKLKIRDKIHSTLIETMETNDESPYLCDDKYFTNPLIKITDFGFYCHNSEKFNESFGTRYYMAPEIILMGDCTEKVDIWALGCMLYELATGEILFDPHSDERGSTNFNHLEMIIHLCGDFNGSLGSSKYYKNYFKNDKLKGIEYKDDKDKSTFDKLNKKLLSHNINDPLLVKFIENMIKISPRKRPSVKELLQDPWLSAN